MNRQIDGAADADRLIEQMTEAELRLGAAADEAIESIMNASPQLRVKRVIETAALTECASDDARIAVANQIVGFARTAVELLERGDFRGLENSLSGFSSRVRSVAQLQPPQPALMPGLATFTQFHWSSADARDLQMVLLLPMLGAKRGDTVTAIDENSVTLSSGLKLTKDAIVRANIPANQVR